MSGRPNREGNAIRCIAEWILDQDPDPVVRLRLLRDVLCIPCESAAFEEAKRSLDTCRRVQELESAQWKDGSWGRLHSKDYSVRQKIPTTEVGVERAVALGLDVDHPVVQNAAHYLVGVLGRRVKPRDRAEKNDRWPTGVQLFAAAPLAHVQADHPVLDDVRQLWVKIARRTFASGSYDSKAEIRAHRDLTGASVENSYLVLDNKYTLTLLGSLPSALNADLEAALVTWVWRKNDGIRYLGEAMSRPPNRIKPAQFERWFTSLEVLLRFPSSRMLIGEIMQWLWDQQAPGSLWDFGPKPSFSAALPLSDSWRKPNARKFDWTTRVLVLLRRYHGKPRP